MNTELVSLALFALLFFFIELVYFAVARRFHIVDQPNHRSSHVNTTIRGGGIIFPLAILLYYPFSAYHWFFIGLLLIALISFLDDLHSVSNKIRLCIHGLAVSLLFYDLGLFDHTLWSIILGYIFAIAIVNAYNFMDGINGITGLYSLSFSLSIAWVDQSEHMVDSMLLIPLIAAILIFLFFNFRQKAKCFAGDIGSISIAFIICFFLLSLIIASKNLIYLGFLLVYGLDTTSTMIFRFIRQENIFEAHRSHFYQFLTNEKKIPALWVSAIYASTQALINIFIIWRCQNHNGYHAIALLSIATISFGIFVLLRLMVEGKQYLFTRSRC